MDDTTNAVFSAMWASAALVCLVISLWFTVKFFQNSAATKGGKRFREAAAGTALLGATAVCIALSVSSYQYGLAGMMTGLPMAVCLGSLALLIGIMGMYWRSFQGDLFARHANVVGTLPASTRLTVVEPSQSSRLPGPAERAGVAVMSWALGACAIGAMIYLLAEPSTRIVAIAVAPLIAFAALAAFVGPFVWLWLIRKRESGL